LEIVNYEEMPPGAKEIATFGVYLGPNWGITYNFFKIRKGKHGIFVCHPSKGTGEEGNLTWTPYVEMSKERKTAFDAQVIELLKPYTGNR